MPQAHTDLLKPDILFGNLTKLSEREDDQAKFLKAKLNEELRKEVLNYMGRVSDPMAKALHSIIQGLDYQQVADSTM